MGRFVRMGATAGLCGGAVLALFLRLVGEQEIGEAVRLEAARAGGTAHDELFSRATQQVGGVIGAVLYGVCLGVVAAVVLAAVRHRMAPRDDWHRAVGLAAVAFVVLSLVPALKYPPNPPAVGDPSTITRRTVLYLIMVGWSVVAAWAGWRLSHWLAGRGAADHERWTAVVVLVAALVAIGWVVLPGSPDGVTAPATLVWRFRVASLGGSAAYWGTTGLALGWLLTGSRRWSATDRKDPTVPRGGR